MNGTTSGAGIGVASGEAQVTPMIDLNPLNWLGEQAQESLADGFTSMMMGLWSAGMWLLMSAFDLIDAFTPNVADPGLSKLYSLTLWVAFAIALFMALAQIGLSVLRHDSSGFATLLAGVVQYGVVVACWVGVCAGIVTSASGLTEAILETLLGVDSFAGYAAADGLVDTVSGTVQSAVLGICALFVLIPAAFGHIVIMLVRSGSLLILTATMPIAAAGALSEGTKSWMWKSVRWFLACALIEPLLALVLGLGTQFAWAGMPDGAAVDGSSTAQNIGTSVVGTVILLVSCFTPLALFRLLAFVDPGTSSGASFRSTMNANGGVAGLMRGSHTQATGGGASGSSAASQTSSDGRTTSENGAEAETANRWQASTLAKVGGKVGGTAAWAMTKAGTVAQAGASLGVDVMGQSGVGSQGYYDTNHNPRGGNPEGRHPGQLSGTQMGGPRGSQQSHDDQHQDHESAIKGPGQGVANEIPPQAQAAVEEGAFLA